MSKMISDAEVLVYVNGTPSDGEYQTPPSLDCPPPPTPNITTMTVQELQLLAKIIFYLDGVCTAVVILLGVLGNALAILVLTRRTMRSSTNIFLTALAVWDTVVLLVVLLLICLMHLSRPFFDFAGPYVVAYIYPVGLVAQTATVWLTVSFTVERYIAVCHPLKAASMCTIPRARMVVLIISAVSVLYNVPRWFEYSVVSSLGPVNQTCIGVKHTSLANDSIYHKIYFGWLYFLVMCFIPLCSLAILNLFLIVAVRRSKHQRRNMNVKDSRENNVTIMLVSVVMVFIICQVPALIYNMAYSISMREAKSSFGWEVLSHFRNFLVTLNSAVNFILYCALGQKFRRTFVRTFCPCLVRRMPGRFQSFSFNRESKMRLTVHTVRNNGTHNGSNNNGTGTYPGVGYHQCRADKEPGIDMKVLRRSFTPRESSVSNSNESEGNGETYTARVSQRSNLQLLPKTLNGKACRAS